MKSHKSDEFLWDAIKKLLRGLTTELIYLELSTYFSLLESKRMYAVNKVPS